MRLLHGFGAGVEHLRGTARWVRFGSGITGGRKGALRAALALALVGALAAPVAGASAGSPGTWDERHLLRAGAGEDTGSIQVAQAADGGVAAVWQQQGA